ncbi:MAG: hypothetical protein IJU98_11405 [Synergistaceae bacterium]|nr:hypothetical protein [Synergistaceae bacterium]
MAKLYDLAVKVGDYLKDGKLRNRYENIGAIWEGRDGEPFMTMKATFNPAAIARKEGSDSIFVSCFPPKDGHTSGDGGGYRGGDNPAPARQEPYNGPKEDFSFRQGPEGYDEADVPF